MLDDKINSNLDAIFVWCETLFYFLQLPENIYDRAIKCVIWFHEKIMAVVKTVEMKHFLIFFTEDLPGLPIYFSDKTKR